MKRPRAHCPPRPYAIARRKARTRTEAAAELVRLEYERDRLSRDLASLEARRAQTLGQLRQLGDRVDVLQDMLAQDPLADIAPDFAADRTPDRPAPSTRR